MERPGMSDVCARFGMGRINPDRIRHALSLKDFDSGAAQLLMSPRPRARFRLPEMAGEPKRAGVLLLLYYKDGELNFTLELRAQNLVNHKGQISLPGGAMNPGETVMETALRETHEELGILMDACHILGKLTPLYIPVSDFQMHPFVAFYPSLPHFIPAPDEVADIYSVPVACLLDPDVHRVEDWVIRGNNVEVPFYELDEKKVWGATAIVLSEFEQRLQIVIDQDLGDLERRY